MVIGQVFSTPGPGPSVACGGTVSEAMRAGIAGQLAVLDDASLTGSGVSWADVLAVPAAVLADRLAGRGRENTAS